MSPQEEKNLIEACLRNDRQAQFRLYEFFAVRLMPLCKRYARTNWDADDILQEGFIKAFKYLKDFKNNGSFEGWIRRIFVNTAIEHFRRKRYLQPVTEKEENTLEGNYLSVLDNLAERDIMELVQQLSPGYRTVFNMYVVEGYTHKEIGQMLEISISTSKSQLMRARDQLQRKIIGTAAAPKSQEILQTA